MEASVAAPAQGAPPAAQPPASGQGPAGQGQATGSQAQQQAGSFNWGLFPNVPENQRELLQPHLTNVLGHVTRMEQQYSPYKGLMDQVGPDQVQNLLTFLNNYSTDPVATWLGLAQSLQEEGLIQNPEFSVDSIQAMLQAQGQGLPDLAEMGDVPPWAQQLMQEQQGISQYIQQQQQAENQRAAAEESRQQEALLGEAKSTIRENLKASGIRDDLVSDEQIVAALIVHKGDISMAAQSFTGLRDGFLTDFTNTNSNGSRPPTIRGDTPQAPKEGLRPRGGDPFRQASVGAQQFLAQSAAAEGS
jgi:hypothetical protein